MPTKDTTQTEPTVLVGTYRKDQLQKWILPKGFYNYAIHAEDTAIRAAAADVRELWLYLGKAAKRRFSATFEREVSVPELAEMGYPRSKAKPHADRYLLFRVAPLEDGGFQRRGAEAQRLNGGASRPGEPRILVRLEDFEHDEEELKAKLANLFGGAKAGKPTESEKPFSYLDCLPDDLLSDWAENLCVCEAAEQLDFYDYFIEPYTVKQPIKHAKKKSNSVSLSANDKVAPISSFPEAVDEKRGLKFYGSSSLETQLAVLSQFLHNGAIAGTGEDEVRQRHEIATSIIGFLERKKALPNDSDGWTEEEIFKVAEAGRQDIFSGFFDVPFPGPEHPIFTFIDLFAGMGGFRIAMQAHGGKCVFSSEWNKFAQQTYLANFGEMPFGDITKEITKKYIPAQFDVLCAGFPCQPFSIAGVSKKKSLGRETGFKDKTQGTLFFDVADIISRHRPKAFFLENVKNLVSHDKGNTFRVIRETLEELNYSIHYRVMDGQAFVPQHRERIMIVGFDRERYHGEESFQFPDLPVSHHAIRDILISHPDPKYTLTDKLWRYLQNYAKHHQEKGNGFGFGMTNLDGVSRTLSARYYKDGSEILIPQGNGENPRRLTPRECARLMGYPDSYDLSAVSEVQAYRQCGNSVIVPLITAVSKKLVEVLV